MATIGDRIAENRRRIGLTQEGLAERLGVTPQAVSKWECDASCPDIALLPLIAEIFSITTDELLTGKAPTSKDSIPECDAKGAEERSIYITVFSDNDTVKIHIPMPIAEAAVKAGLKLGAIAGEKSLSEVSLEDAVRFIRDGAVGEIMTVETDDGNRVVICAR